MVGEKRFSGGERSRLGDVGKFAGLRITRLGRGGGRMARGITNGGREFRLEGRMGMGACAFVSFHSRGRGNCGFVFYCWISSARILWDVLGIQECRGMAGGTNRVTFQDQNSTTRQV